MNFADRVLAADPDPKTSHACLAIASRARNRDDARLLLAALRLGPAAWRWDAARVAAVVLARCRHGRSFTAATIRRWLPQRAQQYVTPALRHLQDEDLTRKLPGGLWQLTAAGDRLAARLGPATAAVTLPAPLN